MALMFFFLVIFICKSCKKKYDLLLPVGVVVVIVTFSYQRMHKNVKCSCFPGINNVFAGGLLQAQPASM